MLEEISLDFATRLINHGPVIFVSSVSDGNIDVTPVAWHMPISKKPPVIALEISETHYIYECITKSKNFVINIPPKTLAEEIVKCGSCSGRNVDKVKLCGFEVEKSAKIESLRLKGMLASCECVLVEDKHVMNEYNIILGKVECAFADKRAFDEHWTFSKDELKTIHHLGDRTFCFPDGEIVDLRTKLNKG